MSKRFFVAAFAIGAAAVLWVALGFVGAGWLPLAMTVAIAAVYLVGAFELRQYRAASAGLAAALDHIPQPLAQLADWLPQVPPSLRNTVRLRVEGERVGLPGPALTPYLVGLLVMLGMLGTFLGMVVTFKGAVFALEGSTDLQAIRSALAAPIKGLGLSFGTSVAGVAASAMLGLMSAIGRRERLELARQLDALIATTLLPFSRAQQRQETVRAVQAQAHALPQVVHQLEAMMERMERRSEQLDAQLLARHAQLQVEVTRAYGELAHTVGAALKESLDAGAAAAGESIRPVVVGAMAQVVQEAQRLHERLGTVAQDQVDTLSQQFDATARNVAQTWSAALQRHERSSEAVGAGLERSLLAFGANFEQRSASLVATVADSLAHAQSDQERAQQQKLQAFTQALAAMSADLQAQWVRAGEQAVAQQQAVWTALEQASSDITQRTATQAGRTLGEVARLLDQSHALVHARSESEARWSEQHGQRMDQLAGLWRSELAALRQDESLRGEAAVARLGDLQGEVTRHLATLGAALEAPLTRLLQTAAEVPQAAAGVITELRAEMSRVAERDNLALSERSALLEQLGALLQALQHDSGAQRGAIETLVASAGSLFDRAGQQFAHTLDAHAGAAGAVAAQVTGSALELASLGEAFGAGVQQFQASNEKLVETLQRIEASLQRSTARSDEQLAYYVAQAREVIDLSIASQQGLVDHLRQLQGKAAKPLALVEGSRG
jgi:hypothetical protein